MQTPNIWIVGLRVESRIRNEQDKRIICQSMLLYTLTASRSIYMLVRPDHICLVSGDYVGYYHALVTYPRMTYLRPWSRNNRSVESRTLRPKFQRENIVVYPWLVDHYHQLRDIPKPVDCWGRFVSRDGTLVSEPLVATLRALREWYWAFPLELKRW